MILDLGLYALSRAVVVVERHTEALDGGVANLYGLQEVDGGLRLFGHLFGQQGQSSFEGPLVSDQLSIAKGLNCDRIREEQARRGPVVTDENYPVGRG